MVDSYRSTLAYRVENSCLGAGLLATRLFLGFVTTLQQNTCSVDDSLHLSPHLFPITASSHPSHPCHSFVLSYACSSGHEWMWELDCEGSWGQKNWCFWTVVLEKTLESPLGCKKMQPVHPKGDQPWVFIGRTDAEAETPVLWPPHAKSWLIGKDPDAGRDRGQEEKGTTENEMAGWHHWLDGREFE